MEYFLNNYEYTKCFVCKKHDNNLFSVVNTNANCSGIPILDIFKRFKLPLDLDIPDTNVSSLCSACLNKINEYDLAYESAERIRSELMCLLTEYKIDSNVSSSERIDTKEFLVEPEREIDVLPLNKRKVIKRITRLGRLQTKTTNSKIKNGRKNNDTLANEINDPNLETLNDSNAAEAKDILNVKFETVPDSTKESFKLDSFNCTQKGCAAIFDTAKEILVHRKETGHKKYLICDICDQRFDRKPRYIAHMSFHNGGYNPFECEICGKKLAQKFGLLRHRRLHTGEQPYQCDQCGKRFRQNTSFIAHKLVHDKVQGKKCTVCGIQLSPNASLKSHMMIHTGEKPHECPICKKRFNKRYNMRSHLRVHQGLDAYPLKTCQLCSKTFTRIGKLKEHMVKDHNFVRENLIE